MANVKKNDLGDAALHALPDGGEQGTLEGTNYAKVSFLGMGWETAEVPGLKEEVELVVRGTVVFVGDQVMADGSIRPIVKVKVQSVANG